MKRLSSRRPTQHTSHSRSPKSNSSRSAYKSTNSSVVSRRWWSMCRSTSARPTRQPRVIRLSRSLCPPRLSYGVRWQSLFNILFLDLFIYYLCIYFQLIFLRCRSLTIFRGLCGACYGAATCSCWHACRGGQTYCR